MKKKEYLSPEILVVKCDYQGHLLSESITIGGGTADDGDNPIPGT